MFFYIMNVIKLDIKVRLGFVVFIYKMSFTYYYFGEFEVVKVISLINRFKRGIYVKRKNFGCFRRSLEYF